MFRKMICLAAAFAFVVTQSPLALAVSFETGWGNPSTTIGASASASKKPTVSAATQTAAKWNTASEKFLKTAAKDVDITAATKELSDYTKELQTAINDNKLFDSSTANKNYLTAALTYVKSAEFSKLTDDQKISYIKAVRALGVEIWRGNDTSAEKTACYNQLAEITKSVLNDKSSSVIVKAQALDSFAYIFGLVNRDSPKEALKILKTALNVTGGMESVITILNSNINNSKLTDDQRGEIVVAAEKMLSLEKYIETATGYSMSDKLKSELKTQINSFIEKVTDGSVKIDSWLLAQVINQTGMIAANLVNKKENASGINKKLVDNFVKLAQNTMLSSGSDAAAVFAKATAISRLSKLKASADKVKDTGLAKDIESALLSKDFDVKDFLSDVKAALAKDGLASTEAVLLESSSLLVAMNIENNTGAIDAATANDLLNAIKDWTSEPENILGATDVTHLTGLFTNAARLLTAAESKKFITAAQKKSYGESLLAAAKTVSDETVRNASVKAINAALTADSQPADPPQYIPQEDSVTESVINDDQGNLQEIQVTSINTVTNEDGTITVTETVDSYNSEGYLTGINTTATVYDAEGNQVSVSTANNEFDVSAAPVRPGNKATAAEWTQYYQDRADYIANTLSAVDKNGNRVMSDESIQIAWRVFADDFFSQQLSGKSVTISPSGVAAVLSTMYTVLINDKNNQTTSMSAETKNKIVKGMVAYAKSDEFKQLTDAEQTLFINQVQALGGYIPQADSVTESMIYDDQGNKVIQVASIATVTDEAGNITVTETTNTYNSEGYLAVINTTETVYDKEGNQMSVSTSNNEMDLSAAPVRPSNRSMAEVWTQYYQDRAEYIANSAMSEQASQIAWRVFADDFFSQQLSGKSVTVTPSGVAAVLSKMYLVLMNDKTNQTTSMSAETKNKIVKGMVAYAKSDEFKQLTDAEQTLFIQQVGALGGYIPQEDSVTESVIYDRAGNVFARYVTSINTVTDESGNITVTKTTNTFTPEGYLAGINTTATVYDKEGNQISVSTSNYEMDISGAPVRPKEKASAAEWTQYYQERANFIASTLSAVDKDGNKIMNEQNVQFAWKIFAEDFFKQLSDDPGSITPSGVSAVWNRISGVLMNDKTNQTTSMSAETKNKIVSGMVAYAKTDAFKKLTDAEQRLFIHQVQDLGGGYIPQEDSTWESDVDRDGGVTVTSIATTTDEAGNTVQTETSRYYNSGGALTWISTREAVYDKEGNQISLSQTRNEVTLPSSGAPPVRPGKEGTAAEWTQYFLDRTDYIVNTLSAVDKDGNRIMSEEAIQSAWQSFAQDFLNQLSGITPSGVSEIWGKLAEVLMKDQNDQTHLISAKTKNKIVLEMVAYAKTDAFKKLTDAEQRLFIHQVQALGGYIPQEVSVVKPSDKISNQQMAGSSSIVSPNSGRIHHRGKVNWKPNSYLDTYGTDLSRTIVKHFFEVAGGFTSDYGATSMVLGRGVISPEVIQSQRR